MKRIILGSGWANSGKDFTMDLLKKQISDGLTIEEMKFADVMKDIICGIFRITRHQLDKYKDNPKDFIAKITTYTPAQNGVNNLTEYDLQRLDFRGILQRFGSDVMKPIFGKDVWTDLLYKRIKESDADVILISDWRFKQELWRLQILNLSTAYAFITVRVMREDLKQISEHISEVDLNDGIDFEHTLYNDGKTISSLEKQLRYLIQVEGL